MKGYSLILFSSKDLFLPLFCLVCKNFFAMLTVTNEEMFTKDGSFFVVFSLARLQLDSIIFGIAEF